MQQEFKERDASLPAEKQGIFRKFEVRRVDGSDQPGGKHHGCRYFVLDLDHDHHASAAMNAYGHACAGTHPELSREVLTEWPSRTEVLTVKVDASDVILAVRSLTEGSGVFYDELVAVGWTPPQPVAEQGELPPLPEPFGRLERRLGVFQKNIEIHDVHTADQMREYARAAIAAHQVKEIDHGDIFDLIREWAHLPEGQRHHAAHAIIGRMNQSYAAGVADGKVLGAASQQAAEPVAWVYECRQPHTDPVIWAEFFSRTKPSEDSTWVRNIHPLHNAKAAQQPQDELPQKRAQRMTQERFNEKMDALDAANPEPLQQLRASPGCEVCADTGTAFGKPCHHLENPNHG